MSLMCFNYLNASPEIIDGYNEKINESLKPKAFITLLFGTKMPVCDGKINICCIKILARTYIPDDYEAVGVFYVGEDGTSLIFETAMQTGFTGLTYAECFSDGKFKMTVDFLIPENIIHEIGFRGDPVLRPGSYPVEEKGDSLRIIFKR